MFTLWCFFCFFFFQAEDGIRDSSVTGVQTCALPIFLLVGVVELRSVSQGAPVLADRNIDSGGFFALSRFDHLVLQSVRQGHHPFLLRVLGQELLTFLFILLGDFLPLHSRRGDVQLCLHSHQGRLLLVVAHERGAAREDVLYRLAHYIRVHLLRLRAKGLRHPHACRVT